MGINWYCGLLRCVWHRNVSFKRTTALRSTLSLTVKLFDSYTAVGLILVITIAGLGAWPASYAIGGETSSLRLRAKSQGLAWFVNSMASAIFSAFLPFLYNTDAANLKGKTGFVYCFTAAVTTVLGFLYIPELKGLTPAEVDDLFESNRSARKFRRKT